MLQDELTELGVSYWLKTTWAINEMLFQGPAFVKALES